MFTKEEQALVKPCYESIRKISKGKWEWEPEVGEWFFYPVINSMSLPYIKEKKMAIFLCTAVTAESQGRECYLEYPMGGRLWKANKRDCMPILEWQRIEETLEGMGYMLDFGTPQSIHFWCRISKISSIPKDGNYCVVDYLWGKSRQEAVVRAVIEMGKEIE